MVPGSAPADDAFDGRAYYAGRTFCLNGQRILFGWVPTKGTAMTVETSSGQAHFVAHEVYQRGDGTLGVRIPDTVWNAFEEGEKAEDMVIDTPYARREQNTFQ